MSKKLLQSASGFINQSSGDPIIDDMFKVYGYEGNGSNGSTNLLEIRSGLDFKNNEGFVILKNRENGNADWHIYDTIRGENRSISTNRQYGESYITNNPTIYGVTKFDDFNFKLGSGISGENINHEAGLAWCFINSPRFVDCVQYTGNNQLSKTVAHNLGCDIGMIWVKRTDVSGQDWGVWHRGNGTTDYTQLSLNDQTHSGSATGIGPNYYSYHNSTTFNPNYIMRAGSPATGEYNIYNATYMAYIFAHDTSDGNVIQCGEFNVTSVNDIRGEEINLGWQPQALMYRRVRDPFGNADDGHWYIIDTLRGWAMAPLDYNGKALRLNESNAEQTISNGIYVGTKGFGVPNGGYFPHGGDGDKFIYMAIRNRGMRLPVNGLQVYKADNYASGQAQALHPKHYGHTGTYYDGTNLNTWEVDLFWEFNEYNNYKYWRTRYMMNNNSFNGSQTSNVPQVSLSSTDCFGTNRGIYPEASSSSTQTYKKFHFFKVHRKVFDMGMYSNIRSSESSMNASGTGGSWTDTSSTEAMYNGTKIKHNLEAVPEMIWIKRLFKNNATYGGQDDMFVWHKDQKSIYSGGNTGLDTVYETRMNGAEHHGYNVIDHTTTGAMTDEHFVVSSNTAVNDLYSNIGNRYWFHYWAWASLDGVSKVGSFTGDTTNGVTVNCGFQPRFIMMENSNPSFGGNSYWVVFSFLHLLDSGSQSYDIWYPMVEYADVIDHNAFTITSTGFNMTASTTYPQIHENGKRHLFLAIA